MLTKSITSFVCFAILSTITSAALAANGDDEASTRGDAPSPRKTVFAPMDKPAAVPNTLAESSRAGMETAALVFSAPPRETPAEGRQIYQPVAEYLSKIIGKPVTYKHPGNWLVYQTEMVRGGYDLVFDGPHFNSWRSDHMQHNILVKLAEEHTFTIIVRKDGTQVSELKHLTGKIVCGMNPPNLGTLAVLREFDNPARQPVIRNTTGWNRIYQGVVIEKKCVAGIVPIANLAKYDGGGTFTRIIHKTNAMPNQGFSAGPRVSSADQAKIKAALMSVQAEIVTKPLRAMYGSNSGFVPTAKDEYAGLAVYLKDVWGYAH